MKKVEVAPPAAYFKEVKDPRVVARTQYPLIEVIIITILAFIGTRRVQYPAPWGVSSNTTLANVPGIETCAVLKISSPTKNPLMGFFMSGARGWEDIETYGLAKEAWLRKFPTLKYVRHTMFTDGYL